MRHWAHSIASRSAFPASSGWDGRHRSELGTEDLRGFDLATVLAERLRRPVRVANDAEIQGLAAIEGEGLEMIITLGTGFGTALFEDGRSLPHLELAHHPFHKGKTYEQLLGKKALQRAGRKKWNRTLERAIHTLRMLVHYDRLYIGGGNARTIGLQLDGDTTVVSNKLGVKVGLALWLGQSGGRARRPSHHPFRVSEARELSRVSAGRGPTRRHGRRKPVP